MRSKLKTSEWGGSHETVTGKDEIVAGEDEPVTGEIVMEIVIQASDLCQKPFSTKFYAAAYPDTSSTVTIVFHD